MKKQRFLPFIFFLIILQILSSTLVTTSSTKGMYEVNTTEQTYDLFVNSEINTTTIYIDIQEDFFEFKVDAFHWGEEFEGIYKGLLIEIYNDSDNSELNSWLISYNDVGEHYYSIDSGITGIIRINFTSLNVENIGYELILDQKFTIWTYELVTQPLFKTFFGVERSEYNQDVIQLVLGFEKSFNDSSTFSIGIYDEFNETEDYIESSFIYYTENNLILDAYVFSDKWYSINFITNEYNSSDWIAVKLYYDHIDTQFIVRLFLNKGDNSLYEIPLDLIHSNHQYFWSVQYYSPQDPGYYFILVIFTILKYLIIAILIGGFIIAFLRALYKRRKSRISSDFSPSEKYEYSNKNVSYQPEPTHSINFDMKARDYELQTTESSKVKCSICMQIIEDHSKIIRCPSCDVAYHKNHLYQWIVSNGTCPICKSRLRITSR